MQKIKQQANDGFALGYNQAVKDTLEFILSIRVYYADSDPYHLGMTNALNKVDNFLKDNTGGTTCR